MLKSIKGIPLNLSSDHSSGAEEDEPDRPPVLVTAVIVILSFVFLIFVAIFAYTYLWKTMDTVSDEMNSGMSNETRMDYQKKQDETLSSYKKASLRATSNFSLFSANETPTEEPPTEENLTEEVPAEETPVEETPTPEEELPLTVEEVVELVEELIGSGEITEADAEAVLDALSADGEISVEEVNNLSEALSEDGVLTLAEKDLVADALVQSAEGDPITAANIEAAGLEYRDLPPLIPVEVREDANGNPVVITAEVASALLTLESPAALAGAIAGCFNPDEAIEGLTEEQQCEVFKALANIGADMSPQERQKAKEVLVAAVLVGQVIVGSAIIRRR